MSLWIAAALAAVAPASAPAQPAGPLAEASHAIGAGRLDQARTMVAGAIAAGASGEEVDRVLAALAFATGDNVGALAQYAKLVAAHPGEGFLAERAGLAALKL